MRRLFCVQVIAAIMQLPYGYPMDQDKLNKLFDAYAEYKVDTRTTGVLLAADRGFELYNVNLQGLDFGGRDLAGAWISSSNLSGANFRGANLWRASMCESDLTGADFTGADLAYARVRESNLTDVIGLPDIERMPIDIAVAKAVTTNNFDMLNYESVCGTTFCRAGHAIRLHPQGTELRAKFGPSMAAALIYNVCSVRDTIPSWVESNESALADIERCAELQRASIQK